MNAVSIIIPIQGRAEPLDAQLRTLVNVNTLQPVELIIVDHTAAASTAEMLARYARAHFVRHIVRSTPYGFAEASNCGAGKAAYPYLLFLSNSITVDTDVLPEALARFESADIGAVGLSPEGTALRADTGYQLAIADLVLQHLGFAGANLSYLTSPADASGVTHPSHQSAWDGYPPAVSNNFLLCRASDFKALNGFSESIAEGLEVIDFCLRLQQTLHKQCYPLPAAGMLKTHEADNDRRPACVHQIVALVKHLAEREELRRENDTLLQQLHQVQEELEAFLG